MSTLRLKKPSTRQAARVVARAPYRAKTVQPATPRLFGGTDAEARLRQMQQDMDRIAKGGK
jgi:hypothetical protein